MMHDSHSTLSQTKGLGSAKSGTAHFWHQRLTAIALIPLVLWFGFSLAVLPTDYHILIALIQNPFVAIGLIVFMIMVFYHAQLGLQVVLEDYIASFAKRVVLVTLTGFISLTCALTGIVVVIKIFIGA